MTIAFRVALLLGAASLLAGAGPAPLAAQATRKGWWVEIKSTQARSITILAGAADTARAPVREWRTGQRRTFDIPGKAQTAFELYILAIAAPKGAGTVLCLHFRNQVAKHLSFDNTTERSVRQTSTDDARQCR